MMKTLSIQENLMKYNKNEIIRMCKNSLIMNLLKCDQFKVIINLITQTLSLWNDFLKVPSKYLFLWLDNNLTKTNIINFRNENRCQQKNFKRDYEVTNVKFIQCKVNPDKALMVILPVRYTPDTAKELAAEVWFIQVLLKL